MQQALRGPLARPKLAESLKSVGIRKSYIGPGMIVRTRADMILALRITPNRFRATWN